MSAFIPAPASDPQAWLSRLGYEIRSSVNSMLGLAEMLLETRLSEEQREYVDVLRFSADRLLATTGDIMELAAGNTEDGDAGLPSEFDLHELLAQTCELMGLLADRSQDGGLKVELHLDDTVQRHVTADRRKLEQIVMTLIGAAIRSGRAGSVSVRVAPAGEGPAGEGPAGQGMVSFTISAPPMTCSAVPPPTPSLHGDISLAVAAQMIASLQGELHVEQNPAGTVARFSLALAPAPGGNGRPSEGAIAEEAAPAARKRESVRVLLADDTPDNQFLVKVYLKGQPCHLDIAADGRIAVEMAKAEQYDVILMDLDMPELDGFAATAQIREWERSTGREEVPIIALTAHVSKENIEQCRTTGFSEHMSKPVTKKAVLAAIERYVTTK